MPEPTEPPDEDALGWWTISGVHLLDLLRRCHAGESPDLVYAEAYANSDRDWPPQEVPVPEPTAPPDRHSTSLTFRGTTLDAGPTFAIELTGAERLLILEALAGLAARACAPWEVTMAWALAQRLEFDRLDLSDG